MSVKDDIASIGPEAYLVELRALSTSELDAFRVEVRKRTMTSDLLIMFDDPGQLIGRFGKIDDDAYDGAAADLAERIVAAALLAIADEINRRIPIPGDS